MKDARTPRTKNAVVALVDAHSAVIDRCAGGTLTRIQTVVAPEPHGTSDHMGNGPGPSFHPGTQGETESDAAQRARASARRTFIYHVAPIVASAAALNDWIVLGGNPIFTSALREALAKSHSRQAIVADDLHRGLPVDAIIASVTAAVDAHLAVQDLADVHTLLERTGAHTTGVVGAVASLDAAEHGAVEVVLMTPRYREQHPAEAERIGIETRTHGGRVETTADGAAELLDAHAGGVGALLRFSLHRMPDATEATRA